MATQDSKTRVRVAAEIIDDAAKFCVTYTEADDKYKLKWAKKRDDIIESLGQLSNAKYGLVQGFYRGGPPPYI